MANLHSSDRIDPQGLIARIAVVMLLVFSLIAIASVYVGGL